MATQTTGSNFDFPQYNAMMKSANSGLKLYLAIQMLQEVEANFRQYRNPLAKELIDAVDELSDIRAKNKKMAEAREKAGNTAEIDNEGLPTEAAKPVADYANKHGDKAASHKETPAK